MASTHARAVGILKQEAHVPGSHVKRYEENMARWAREVDGVYELAMSRLRKKGGPIWTDMAQVDIINTIVDATREYDAGR